MQAFRLLLVGIFGCIFGYTAIVVARHGFGLLAVFFGDIAALGWPGQFNIDFTSLLTLSALWLAWRHHFSPTGVALGVLGFLGGGLFLSAYLFIASFEANGDVRELLLGRGRVDRLG